MLFKISIFNKRKTCEIGNRTRNYGPYIGNNVVNGNYPGGKPNIRLTKQKI